LDLEDLASGRGGAMNELVKRGDIAVPILQQLTTNSFENHHRLDAVWALTQIKSDVARQAIRSLVRPNPPRNISRSDVVRYDYDFDPPVVKAALHSIALHRDKLAFEALTNFVTWAPNDLRRMAAEALGRIGDARAIPVLLKATAQPDFQARKSLVSLNPIEPVLQHSITFALVEIGDARATALGLNSENELAQRAALIALDQMSGGNLQPDQVTPLLSSSDVLLKQTASWIVSHHPDWGDALAGYLSKRLSGSTANDSDAPELQRQLADFARHASVQNVLAAVTADNSAPQANRLITLRAMSAARPKETPTNWPPALAKVVASSDLDVQREAVLAARNLNYHGVELTTALHALLASENTPADIRLNAFAAIKGLGRLSRPAFEFLRSQLDSTNAVATRLLAAEVLGRPPLTPNEMNDLTKTARTAGPLELPKLLAIFHRATNEYVGLNLIDALKQSPSASSLRVEILRPNLTNFPAIVRQRADELLASIHTDTAQEKARINELLESCKNGDVRRGQALFNSPKAACSSCHAIGYLGGNVGPDLTRIGQIRNERDLLEALVYPNASFVRSYEPMIVTTKAGEEYSGVLRKDSAEEVVLATGPNIEQRIARSEIADMRPGSVSVMPSGLADQLKKEELADLLAFLKATRW
jgi:putative heme-binding domain-containing protein